MSLESELLETPEPTENDLETIASLATTQLSLATNVDRLEEELKEAKKKLRQIQENDLPDAMSAIGLASFTLTSGAEIKIEDKFYASIAKARKPACADWLIDNGQSALVKQDFHIPFDATDEDAVSDFEEELEALGVEFSVDWKMNTGSVKAALKQLILEGEEVPMELFGLRRVSEAKITF